MLLLAMASLCTFDIQSLKSRNLISSIKNNKSSHGNGPFINLFLVMDLNIVITVETIFYNKRFASNQILQYCPSYLDM